VHHAVAGVLVDGSRLLLAHRAPTRRWYPDVWDLPGGHVDDGEDEATALRRELEEELGVRSTVVDPAPVLRVDEPSEGLRLAVWVVRSWAGVPVNRRPDEHDEIRCVSRPEIGGLVLAHPGYAGLLASLLPVG
jgi:8-oxo-dGTP diphosphatase